MYTQYTDFSSTVSHLKQIYKVNRKRRVGEDSEEIELLCGLLRGLVLEDATTVTGINSVNSAGA